MGEIIAAEDKPVNDWRPVRERPERAPEVRAEQFVAPSDLRIPPTVKVEYRVNGELIIDGWWIVERDGVIFVMSPEDFERQYEAV